MWVWKRPEPGWVSTGDAAHITDRAPRALPHTQSHRDHCPTTRILPYTSHTAPRTPQTELRTCTLPHTL